jgi:hypothetical protein
LKKISSSALSDAITETVSRGSVGGGISQRGTRRHDRRLNRGDKLHGGEFRQSTDDRLDPADVNHHPLGVNDDATILAGGRGI